MLDSIISSISAEFRQNLTDLVERKPPSEWTPAKFRGFMAGLKDVVNAAGRSVLEATLAKAEILEPEVEHGGKRFRVKEETAKEWFTPFGRVVVNRHYFRPVDRKGGGFCPLDVRCGMQGRYMTPDVEELAAYSCAYMVPGEVEKLIELALPAAPSATAIQRVVKDLGDFITENEDAIEQRIAAKPVAEKEADILVVSWDGVTVPLRKFGVKAGRKPERPGVRKTDESPTSYREAGVASISMYESKWDEEAQRNRPVRVNARFLAKMPEPHMASLISQQEQVLNDMVSKQRFRSIAVICDGKRAIWDCVGALSVLDSAVLILDFYHAAEHLSKAAEILFGKSSNEATAWYERYRRKLRDDDGGITAVVRSIRYYRDQALNPETQRWAKLEKELGYFVRNSDRMEYARYRNLGLPIGSGPVEAACKTVVNHRLKRSGMRWSSQGGQRVLNLRALALSNQWDAAWGVYIEARAA